MLGFTWGREPVAGGRPELALSVQQQGVQARERDLPDFRCSLPLLGTSALLRHTPRAAQPIHLKRSSRRFLGHSQSFATNPTIDVGNFRYYGSPGPQTPSPHRAPGSAVGSRGRGEEQNGRACPLYRWGPRTSWGDEGMNRNHDGPLEKVQRGVMGRLQMGR